MLEDSLDPRPQPQPFAQLIAERAAAHGHLTTLAQWPRGWHDSEGPWTNLRNIEHWLDRGRAG